MSGPESITIASRVDRIDEARTWVTDRVRAAGFGDEPIGEIELALTEALANVVEHAYQDAPDERIELWTELEGSTVRIRVRDWGKYFDPASYRGRDLDDPGEGGYGVFLMSQLMDDVTREPQPDGGTLLTLIKTRKDVSDG
ncbi:MAG: ATP-binding protein [Solirubrobacteraceae bacterium]